MPLPQVIAEHSQSADGHLKHSYHLYGMNRIGQQVGDEWAYFGYDGLGSVRQMTDNIGNLRHSADFDPYGNIREGVGLGNSSFAYTGEQVDPNGLIYLRARYYDPRTGAFLSKDPVHGIVGGASVRWNPYSYVGGNPINHVDPTGMCIDGISTAVCIAGAVAIGATLFGGYDYLAQTHYNVNVNGMGLWDAANLSNHNNKQTLNAAFMGGSLGLGIATAGMTGWAALGWGAADVGAGILWDMGVNGDSFGDALFYNTVVPFVGGRALGTGANWVFRRPQLRRIATNLLEGANGDRMIRGNILGQLRNMRGQPSPRFEGYIFNRILQENVAAISDMRSALRQANPDVILAMERGGAFTVDVLSHNSEDIARKVIKISKASIPSGGRIPSELVEIINNEIAGGARHFALIDNYMGGTAAGELMGKRGIIRSILSENPDVTFSGYWLRETFGFENKALRGMSLINRYGGRVQQNFFPVTAVLGDDMDMIFNGSRRSLRIFNSNGNVIRTATPNLWQTSRDTLIRLMNGG